MKSRSYSRKIIINSVSNVADGYGGYTSQSIGIGSFWANVSQTSSFKQEGQGANGLNANYTFKIRTNKALDAIIDSIELVFNGQLFTVSSYEYDDELFRFVTINATKKQ